MIFSPKAKCSVPKSFGSPARNEKDTRTLSDPWTLSWFGPKMSDARSSKRVQTCITLIFPRYWVSGDYWFITNYRRAGTDGDMEPLYQTSFETTQREKPRISLCFCVAWEVKSPPSRFNAFINFSSIHHVRGNNWGRKRNKSLERQTILSMKREKEALS